MTKNELLTQLHEYTVERNKKFKHTRHPNIYVFKFIDAISMISIGPTKLHFS